MKKNILKAILVFSGVTAGISLVLMILGIAFAHNILIFILSILNIASVIYYNAKE